MSKQLSEALTQEEESTVIKEVLEDTLDSSESGLTISADLANILSPQTSNALWNSAFKVLLSSNPSVKENERLAQDIAVILQVGIKVGYRLARFQRPVKLPKTKGVKNG